MTLLEVIKVDGRPRGLELRTGGGAVNTALAEYVTSMADDDDDLPPGIVLPPGIIQPSRTKEVLIRCYPESDTSITVGDRIGGSWICLAWANGRCASGSACKARHQLVLVHAQWEKCSKGDSERVNATGQRKQRSPCRGNRWRDDPRRGCTRGR